MSNIERKYAYYDEGVLPEEGEYGVTYLTLYSSSAGNIYDGWIYDPDNKIPVSVTERTFGYRHPEFSQYCWDDEVVVDLSNAQSRQESSEFAQGRIASYNTNVSPLPILLEDVDITGLTEEEREAKATTVLFTAIPLVKDAYIHADAEIAMKMNASPGNQTGCIRVEAFYIINDISDRTMRPHPINHYIVTEANQYNLLPLLYFNVALRHDTNNYIGVKLLCTGGTAEIGISDSPEYGDAVIVLASAGLTGDNIYSEEPIALEIFGLDEVNPGYKLNVDDYTVLCTYDSGEIYDVTRVCNYSPAMGSRITQSETTLTAYFQGLSASMLIELSPIDRIELTGNTAIHGSYTLDISDYTVTAYCVNGYEFDITNECEFSPAMGTTVSSNTTLTATYISNGDTFTDSLQLTTVGVSQQTGVDIIYTLYNDGYADITGEISDSWTVDNYYFDNSGYATEYNASITGHGINGATTTDTYNYQSTIGSNISNFSRNYFEVRFPAFFNNANTIEYKLTGKPIGLTTTKTDSFSEKTTPPTLIGFENLDTSKIETMSGAFAICKYKRNAVSQAPDLSFLNELSFPSLKDLRETFMHVDTSSILSLDTSHVESMYAAFKQAKIFNDVFLHSMDTSSLAYAGEMFSNQNGGTDELDNVDFLEGWDFSNVKTTRQMFYYRSNLKNINGVRYIDTSSLEDAVSMFAYCTGLTSIEDTIGRWNNSKLWNASGMFQNCTNLSNINRNGHFYTNLGTSHVSSLLEKVNIASMYKNSGITSLGDMIVGSNIESIISLCENCTKLSDITIAAQWNVGHLTSLQRVFMYAASGRPSGMSLAAYYAPIANWQPLSCTDMRSFVQASGSDNTVVDDLLNNVFSNWSNYLPQSDGRPIDFVSVLSNRIYYAYYRKWNSSTSNYTSYQL